jgi:glycine/D-amino acid oxidase-like deaminating enzyme
MAAIEAAKYSVDVALIDKGRVGCNASTIVAKGFRHEIHMELLS